METQKHIDAVDKAFSNFTMINHTLWQHFGDANPAALFGYLVGEARSIKKQNKLDSAGYFWCKADKIESMFNMSRKVQDAIIKKLVDAGLIVVHTKKVEGSIAISKVRHFKINYEAAYNLVNGIKEKAKPEVVENLPDDLAAIRNVLRKFTEFKGAKFYNTKDDENVLRVARMSGFTPEVSITLIGERIKKWTNAEYNCRYLITSLLPEFDTLYNNINTPKIKPSFNLTVA